MEEPPLVFDCVPITRDNTMSTVELTVLSVMKDVSGNFVPSPIKAEVRQDLILGLKRLKASLRWAYFFSSHPEIQKKDDENHPNLKTGLRPVRGLRGGPRASPQLRRGGSDENPLSFLSFGKSKHFSP